MRKVHLLRAGSVLGLIAIALLATIYAQETLSDSRSLLIDEIKRLADRHVKSGNSMQTSLAINMYQNNAAGLTPPEIAQIYEEEYIRLKDSNKWQELVPDISWIIAGVLFVLLLFRDVLKESLSKFFSFLGSWLYKRLAGTMFFRRIALRYYRLTLSNKYKNLHIPFRPNRPLDMEQVYTPLRAIGSLDVDEIDAYTAIFKYRRLMVIGPPGSGKSMLAKHVTLSISEPSPVKSYIHPIPVLLELHRLNDASTPLMDQITGVLERNNFPNAEPFVSRCLRRGVMILLFDGLDEVNSSERTRVVEELKDFCVKYSQCQVLITCRTVVYKNEFADVVDKTLELVEFSDQQIRRFLRSWEADIPDGKSVDHLMQTLHDRPRIMALARNPLLLTIISYLYADTDFVLPHSRSEFYSLSTDILLRQWHHERNNYKASQKRLILQHLALFNQDLGEDDLQDRRSIELKALMIQVRKLLPSLNLNPDEDTIPILDEIVERSGLLLSIDGGQRFQFAHLTLQEFFAALELLDDAKGLLARFDNDVDTWQETVKLWCGVARDSTELIRKVFSKNPIIAFECLSDAQKVDSELADHIINTFKGRLGEKYDQDAICRAFGAVASDMRPRGADVFDYLQKQLISSSEPELQMAAANALSFTNLHRAVDVLATQFIVFPEVRPALIRMGELAISTFVRLAENGSLEALQDLYTIGTPYVAESILPLLEHEDKTLAVNAAWYLAALLPQAKIEDALRNYQRSRQQIHSNTISWIWAPFCKPSDLSLLTAVGRMAYLISENLDVDIPQTHPPIDTRLVIPLCSIQLIDDFRFSNSASYRLDEEQDIIKLKQKIRELAQRPEDKEKTKLVAEFIKEFLESEGAASPRWRRLIYCLPVSLQFDLIRRLVLSRLPTLEDWHNVFRPSSYNFREGWHYRLFLALLLITSALALIQIVITLRALEQAITPETMIVSLLGLTIIMNWLNFWVNDERDPEALVLNWLAPFYYLLSFTRHGKKKITEDYSLTIPTVLNFLIFAPAIIYLTTLFLLRIGTGPFTLILWTILIGVCVLLWRVGWRHHWAALNPLYQIIR